MRVSTAVLLGLSLSVAQAPPPPPPPAPLSGQPRDVVRGAEPTGTAVIRGRVVAADTGSPIRRATVSLQPFVIPPPPSPPGTQARAVISRPRSVTTDAQGLFEFTGLPAGAYRLIASPGQYSAGYVGMAYGAKQPLGPGMNSPGARIDVADGQRFDKAAIALPRGAVVTGRVTDENGDPLTRVQVFTLFFAPASTRGQRMGMGAQTDDLGQFRLFGLTPGDYAIVAEARGPTFVPPNAPVESEEDRIGFMTTYYPGTPDEAAAQRVRVRAGAETPGVEIRMTTGRMYRVSGIVTDSQGRPSARTTGNLFRPNPGTSSSFGFSTDEQGRFQMRNIPPGNYRVVARGRSTGNTDGMQGEPAEMGNVPLSVQADVEGLVVMTTPGATITGQVIFEPGPPELPPGQQSFQLRVNAAPGDVANNIFMSMPQPALVTPELTFSMKAVHGELLLRAGGPGMFLKSVAVGGRDITDTPYEFKNGDQVTVVMTTRASSLEGIVTDAAGKPVAEAGIVVFSADDKSSWRPNTTRSRRAAVDATGKYRVTGLLPGRYYIVAIPRERMGVPTIGQDASYFEQLAREATTFVVGEDEQRQVDLKVVTGVGG